MAQWKGHFDPSIKIAPSAITWVREACDCNKKSVDVAPDAQSQFCISPFDEQIIPYQNTVSCERLAFSDIQEIEVPEPYCWTSECFDHCTRISVDKDHCIRAVLC